MNPQKKLALFSSTLLIALATSAPSWAAVSVLEASPRELNDAKVPYLEGVKLMGAKLYKDAVAKFRESYGIVASPNSRLMLARALAKINQPVEAYREYEATAAQASELASKQPKYQKTADDARKELDQLRVELAYVTIIPGSEVSIAGKKLTDADWGHPVPVAPGQVTVEITSNDGQIRRKKLRLDPGTTRVLSADFTAASTGGEEKEEADRESPSESSRATSSGGGLNRKTTGYVIGGVGVLGLASFVGTTIAASAIYGDTKEHCTKGTTGNLCTKAAVDNGEGKGQYQGFGLASLVVGVLGVGAGAYLILTDHSSSNSASNSSGTTALQVGPGSVALNRTF